MEFIDVLNFFLYYITSASLYWLIIIDSHISKREEQLFWESYNRINANFRPELNLNKQNYVLTLAILSFTDILLCILALIREIKTDVGRIMHLTFLVVVDHRIFFYLLHLKVVSFQLTKIQAEITDIHRSGFLLSTNLDVENRFKSIRKQYQLVYEMSEQINSVFGVSHLALITLSFHSSVTFLNFSYRLFHMKFIKYHNGKLVFSYIVKIVFDKLPLGFQCFQTFW